MSSDRREYDGDAGAPAPDFSGAANIRMGTIAPAYGVMVPNKATPDYLDYDQRGRGVMVTMFANTGVSYLLGIVGGGAYGLYTGSRQVPQMRIQLKFNAMLNYAGRYGSRYGNMLGVMSVLYSAFEGIADSFEVDRFAGPLQPAAPAVAAGFTGMFYFCNSQPRLIVTAGAVGVGAVGASYAVYSVMGWPYGRAGYLFL